MLGSFPLNQLEQTPEICLMLSLHFVQSLRIMALTVFKASCLAKWPCCEVDDDDSEHMCHDMTGLAIMAGRLGAKKFCLPLAGIACHGLIA